MIPLQYVRSAQAAPRVFGLGSMLTVGFEDGSQVRFVTRGGARGVQAALQRAGLLASR